MMSKVFIVVVVVTLVSVAIAAPAPDGDHVHAPVLVSAPQPGFVPIRPAHFFAHGQTQFFAPAHGPVFVNAPAPGQVFVHAPGPAVVNRPPGTFVFFGHPGFQTVVPVTSAVATTPAPEPTTVAASPTEAPTSASPVATVAPAPAEPAGQANYNFEYGVADAVSGVNLGHNENRNGGAAQGKYFVTLPDGRLQTVNYVADDNGYVADIQYTQN